MPFILTSVFCFPVTALANCVIKYSAAYVKAGLPATAGNFSGKEECERQRKASSASDPSFLHNAWCEGCSDSVTGASLPAIAPASNNVTQFAVQTAVNSLLSGMLNPQQDNSTDLQKQKDTQAAAEVQLAAIKKQKEAEAAEAAGKKAEREKLAAQLKLPDEPSEKNAGVDNPAREVKTGDKYASVGSYDTSMLSAIKRAECAAKFAKLADITGSKGDMQEAKFLNEQSQKVVNGELIDRPCPAEAGEIQKDKAAGRPVTFKDVPRKYPSKGKPGIKRQYD
ncbi:MAG: hypothetical protein WCK75_10260 [Elusimicrobiota bacterium]